MFKYFFYYIGDGDGQDGFCDVLDQVEVDNGSKSCQWVEVDFLVYDLWSKDVIF